MNLLKNQRPDIDKIYCQRYLTRKDLLEKAATMKRFEYSRLGKELKTQTDIARKQYQWLNKIFKPNEKEEPTLKKYNKSNLIYNTKYSFYKYHPDGKKFDKLSFKSKYSFPIDFFNDLNEFNNLNTQKEKTQKKKKTNMYDTASELYNNLLATYFDEYYYLSGAERKKYGAHI